jgi:hypothetical protein
MTVWWKPHTPMSTWSMDYKGWQPSLGKDHAMTVEEVTIIVARRAFGILRGSRFTSFMTGILLNAWRIPGLPVHDCNAAPQYA